MKIRNVLSKAAAVVTAAVMAVSAVPMTAFAQFNMSEFDSGYTYPTEMRGLTAFQIVNDMGAGWNLGNSLESDYNENYWGNPTTTKAMIDILAEKGYTTLRVPVRWDDHYNSDYQIQTDYMDRVETVVNYGLANDMYVILNVHHNDIQQRVSTDATVQKQVTEEMNSIWTQIATRFKDYGDKLIFETINEPRYEEDWTGNADLFACVNLYNETARAAIRATGGNNSERLIMMPTYCASGDLAKINGWDKNGSDDMIAVSIHAYLPFDFAFSRDGHSDWLESDLMELQSFFDRIGDRFISNGIPVVIGEFGSVDKGNTEERALLADIYGGMARAFATQDIPTVWWDNNCVGTDGENFGIFNRRTLSFIYPEISESHIGAYKGDPEAEAAESGERVYVSETKSCVGWGNIGKWDASIITDMADNDKLQLTFTAGNPKLVLSNDDNSTSRHWTLVDPDSVVNGVATWTRASLYAAYGYDFSDLACFYMSCGENSMTATKMAMVFGRGGHTHSYNGAQTVTIRPTATTCGRMTVQCSVTGCSDVKISVMPALGETATKPVVTAISGEGQVTLSWNAVSGATKYYVYSYLNGSYTGQGITTSTSYTVKNLAGGTKYGFVVRAYIGGALTPFTSADIAYATPTGATKPVVTAKAGEGEVTLSWNAVSGATKYYVYSYLNGSYTGQGITTSTSYTVKNLAGGTKYGFVVRAYIGGALTPFTSADIAYATPTGATKPVVTAKAGEGQVTLSWNAVSGATKYYVYSYLNGSYTGQGITTSTSCTVSNLAGGTKYGFVVRAYIGGALTPFTSADIAYATPTLASKPVVTATAGEGEVTLSWNAVSGATKYYVYSYLNGKYTAQLITASTSCTVSNLAGGTKYGFVVRAYIGGALTPFTSADIAYATTN